MFDFISRGIATGGVWAGGVGGGGGGHHTTPKVFKHSTGKIQANYDMVIK